MITLRGQILVSRIGDDPPSVPVCPSKTLSCLRSKTFPCVLAPSPHVSYMWAWCRYTRRHFERTHGKSFERVHGFFFSVFQHKHTYTKHTPRPPTTPRPQRHHDHNDTTTTTTPPPQRHTHHITQHGERNRERQRKRDKTRQEKTRQDKKAREDETRQEGKRREEKR